MKSIVPGKSLKNSLSTTISASFLQNIAISAVLSKDVSFMLRVKSRAGESVQQMIRRFKKLCEKEGLIKDMKRNAYYEKPSERERRRIRKAQRTLSYNTLL